MRTCNAYHTQYFMEKIVNSLEENPHRKNIMKVWKSYSTEDVITYRKKKKKNQAPNSKCCLCMASGEKAMATHSGTLAWKIPWAEEPGGLQSMRLLRVGHD